MALMLYCKILFLCSFSIKSYLPFWKKCDVVPLPCSCLLCNQVRYQVMVEADGTLDVDSDLEALLLVNLAQENDL